MSILVNDTCNFCPFGSELFIFLAVSSRREIPGKPEGLAVTVLAALALAVQTQPNPWQKKKAVNDQPEATSMLCICLDLDQKPHTKCVKVFKLGGNTYTNTYTIQYYIYI